MRNCPDDTMKIPSLEGSWKVCLNSKTACGSRKYYYHKQEHREPGRLKNTEDQDDKRFFVKLVTRQSGVNDSKTIVENQIKVLELGVKDTIRLIV